MYATELGVFADNLEKALRRVIGRSFSAATDAAIPTKMNSESCWINPLSHSDMRSSTFNTIGFTLPLMSVQR